MTKEATLLIARVACLQKVAASGAIVQNCDTKLEEESNKLNEGGSPAVATESTNASNAATFDTKEHDKKMSAAGPANNVGDNEDTTPRDKEASIAKGALIGGGTTASIGALGAVLEEMLRNESDVEKKQYLRSAIRGAVKGLPKGVVVGGALGGLHGMFSGSKEKEASLADLLMKAAAEQPTAGKDEKLEEESQKIVDGGGNGNEVQSAQESEKAPELELSSNAPSGDHNMNTVPRANINKAASFKAGQIFAVLKKNFS